MHGVVVMETQLPDGFKVHLLWTDQHLIYVSDLFGRRIIACVSEGVSE